MPQLRLTDGADPAEVKWPDVGYADAYLRSYETFTALRGDGVIPGSVRFQTEYPTPLASISAYIVPEQQQVLLGSYERAMFANLDRLLAAVPRHEVAVQWDVAARMGHQHRVRNGPRGPGRHPASLPTPSASGSAYCSGLWPAKGSPPE